MVVDLGKFTFHGDEFTNLSDLFHQNYGLHIDLLLGLLLFNIDQNKISGDCPKKKPD
jgi:hypothetical protein